MYSRRQNLLLLTLGIAALLAGLVMSRDSDAADGRSALESSPQGWRTITPNEKLEGWTRLPVPAGAPLGRQQWHVDPQTKHLICDGDGGHDWLRYDRELKDFIYHVEWRYVPVEGRSGYNSGVYFRNSADGTIWHQAQVGSSFGGYLFGNTPMGGEPQRFNFKDAVTEQRVKRAGEWNTYEVTCRANTVSLWVNGGVTHVWAGCEVPRGFVGLEGEGWKIEFRNLRVKEL